MNKNIRIVFLRDNKFQPVGCVAIEIDRDTIKYSYSVLNPHDHFDRKLSRHIALGRLLEIPRYLEVKSHRVDGPTIEYANGYNTLTGKQDTSKMTRHHITSQVMQDLVSCAEKVPTRAIKAAKLWLRKAAAFDAKTIALK